MSTDFVFDTPLREGRIIKRRNRFIMEVEIDGSVVDCHCPTTGRIGNIVLENIPCLLSKSTDATRKTPYTVEAISVDPIDRQGKGWIGINQNAANRYVEFYLKNGGFSEMLACETANVYREQKLGISKLDFRVGDTYIEVKTPLVHMQVECGAHIKTKPAAPFSSTDRFVKHISELASSLGERQRAILITCFLYDNPGFEVGVKSTNSEFVGERVRQSTEKGVEIWQANFEITPQNVKLIRYFRLSQMGGK